MTKFKKTLRDGMMATLILTDLQKAFDTIDPDLLLQKLYAIGFSKHILNWFKPYLSYRSFLVNLGNNFSQLTSISCDVHEGFILGPLLFLIYVNDMSQDVRCNILFYTNDSCLICQHKDIREIENQLNEDF